MPVGVPDGAGPRLLSKERKRRDPQGNPNAGDKPTEHSTILFAATRHHVEYLAALLRHAGFAVSYVYGSLDQTARRIQTEDFRRGRTNLLVVTDVVAHGIDFSLLQPYLVKATSGFAMAEGS